MVQIKCKNCGRMAESSTFVIDAIIGKLVCPQCVKDRKIGHHSTTTNQPTQNTQFTGPGTSMPSSSSMGASRSVSSSNPSQTSRPASAAPSASTNQRAQPGQMGDLTSMMLNRKPNPNATPFDPFAKQQASQPSQKHSMEVPEYKEEASKQKFTPTFGGSNRASQQPTQVQTSKDRGGGIMGLFGGNKPKQQATTPNAPIQNSISKVSKNHPADWDADDDALERAPQKTAPDKAPKLDDTHIQLTCQRCNYKIKYDVFKQSPGVCPYCGEPIDKSKVRY